MFSGYITLIWLLQDPPYTQSVTVKTIIPYYHHLNPHLPPSLFSSDLLLVFWLPPSLFYNFIFSTILSVSSFAKMHKNSKNVLSQEILWINITTKLFENVWFFHLFPYFHHLVRFTTNYHFTIYIYIYIYI